MHDRAYWRAAAFHSLTGTSLIKDETHGSAFILGLEGVLANTWSLLHIFIDCRHCQWYGYLVWLMAATTIPYLRCSPLYVGVKNFGNFLPPRYPKYTSRPHILKFSVQGLIAMHRQINWLWFLRHILAQPQLWSNFGRVGPWNIRPQRSYCPEVLRRMKGTVLLLRHEWRGD